MFKSKGFNKGLIKISGYKKLSLNLILLSIICSTFSISAGFTDKLTNMFKVSESKMGKASVGILALAGAYGLYHWYTNSPVEIGDAEHSTIAKLSSSETIPTITETDPAQVNKLQAIEKDGCFYNNTSENRWHHLTHALQIFWITKTTWNEYYTVDVERDWVKKDPVSQSSVDLNLQWIGHASFLIQTNNFNILTDPIFGDLNPILYQRKTPVGITPEQLPKIDFVIISHNHHDHLDESSMRKLKTHQPFMLVPAGLKKWFTKRGFKHVIENKWWQKNKFTRDGKKIEFTFVPAEHWSGRGALDPHQSLWGGWVIKSNDKTLYFAGDTAFNSEHCTAIKACAGTQIDYALLPIGPCETRHLMAASHISAEEALNVFKLIDAKTFVPMHWGTFRLGPDTFDDPMKRLDAAWATQLSTLSDKTLCKFKFGERKRFDKTF